MKTYASLSPASRQPLAILAGLVFLITGTHSHSQIVEPKTHILTRGVPLTINAGSRDISVTWTNDDTLALDPRWADFADPAIYLRMSLPPRVRSYASGNLLNGDFQNMDGTWQRYFSLPWDDSPSANSPKATVPAAFSEMTAPSPPSLTNGTFEVSEPVAWNQVADDSKDYLGGKFQYKVVAVAGWTAYKGTKIEVWKSNDNQGTFIELNCNNNQYGIKQPIQNPVVGGYVLAWKELGRKNPKCLTNKYHVKIYQGEEEIARLSPSRDSATDAWKEAAFAFQITEAHIAAAAGSPIYVAFIPENNNSFGCLIDDVVLAPVEVIDKDKNPISTLKVGKMVESGVLSRIEESATLDIDKDSDRFFVRVKNGASLGGISIKVSTTDNPEAEDYNDNATQIDLVAVGEDAISKSILLVADDVDDDHPVDGVEDDATGDRTHKIQLGGNFAIDEIKIRDSAWQAMTTKISVPLEKTVHLNIVRMADCNRTVIDDDIRRTKERFAQIGIKIVIDSDDVKPIPANKMTSSDIYTTITGPFSAPIGRAAQDLIDLYGTETIDDIHIIYCKSVIDQNPVAGVAYLERTLSEGAYSKYANNLFVSSTAKPFTLAHELGHILTNSGHFANPAIKPTDYSNNNYIVDHNLMKEGTSTQDSLDATKRIYPEQGGWIKSHRAAK